MSGRFYQENDWLPSPRPRFPRPLWLLLVSLVSGAGGLYYALHWQPLAPAGGRVYASRSPSLDPSPPLLEQWTSTFPSRRFLTLLLLGVDEDKVMARSDTMMLLLLDLQRRRMAVVSIPRDTKVELPGYGTQKINAAHAFGGVPLARQAVESLLGCRVDYYVKTNVAGFVELVDLLGGVRLQVEKRMRYVDRSQGLFIRLDPGEQWLDGQKAMQYVRFRHDLEGDLGRIRRQQKFLRALVRQALQPENWSRLPRLLEHLPKAVETDLNLLQMKALLGFLREVNLEETPALQLPGTPQVQGLCYWVVEPTQAALFFQRVLESLQEEPSETRLLVCLPAQRDAWGQEACRRLEAEGFRVTECRTDPDLPTDGATTIVDLGHHYYLAQRLRRLLGAGEIQRKDSWLGKQTGVDLAVMIGSDVAWASKEQGG